MALVLFINELPEGDSIQEFYCSPEEFSLNYHEAEVSSELKVTANVSKMHDQLLFKGDINLTVRLSCARCTDEFDKKLDTDLVFVLKFVSEQDQELLEEGDSDDYYFLPEGTLEFNFSEIIRDKIILNIEMKPLCSESCQGLCSQCGQNLNLESCNCNKEIVDERWLPLKELRDRRK